MRFLQKKGVSSQTVYGSLNGVNRRPLNGVKFNRQPSKKVVFSVNCQKLRVILTVKTFQGISNPAISADLHGLLALEESVNLKTHRAMFSKTLSLNSTRPYNFVLS